jgi:hypothetical protein
MELEKWQTFQGCTGSTKYVCCCLRPLQGLGNFRVQHDVGAVVCATSGFRHSHGVGAAFSGSRLLHGAVSGACSHATFSRGSKMMWALSLVPFSGFRHQHGVGAVAHALFRD